MTIRFKINCVASVYGRAWKKVEASSYDKKHERSRAVDTLVAKPCRNLLHGYIQVFISIHNKIMISFFVV